MARTTGTTGVRRPAIRVLMLALVDVHDSALFTLARCALAYDSIDSVGISISMSSRRLMVHITFPSICVRRHGLAGRRR